MEVQTGPYLGGIKPRGGSEVERHLGKDRMGNLGVSRGEVQDRDQNLNDVEITPVAIKMGVKNTNKELSFANKILACNGKYETMT